MTAVYFDRKIHSLLHAAVQPNGFAHELVEYGRSGQYGLDLQFRRNPKTAVSTATLYVGTTKVLDVVYMEKTLTGHLSAHQTWATEAAGWSDQWRKTRPFEHLPSVWPQVSRYLEKAIPRAFTPPFSGEGRLQAALSMYPSDEVVVIDRESVVGFVDEPTKSKIRSHLLAPLLSAVAGKPYPWWSPAIPGDECDALAIDRAGHLVTIEVKAGEADSLIWSPLQAIAYAGLFARWIEEVGSKIARNTVNAMYRQRADLGLVRADFAPRLMSPLKVQARVVFGDYPPSINLLRLRQVLDVLEAAGVDMYGLTFWRANLVGRLTRWDVR